MDFPFWIAATEAPDPRCSEITDTSSGGYHVEKRKGANTSANRKLAKDGE
jgi:hypothetical protein